jgi:hypothetical protein
MLEQRSMADKSAVLLGFVAPEPALDERTRSFSFASRKNDGPNAATSI